jgi:hypothetical protein
VALSSRIRGLESEGERSPTSRKCTAGLDIKPGALRGHTSNVLPFVPELPRGPQLAESDLTTPDVPKLWGVPPGGAVGP